MELIISLLMGTRLLTLLGGGIGHDVPVAFSSPEFILTKQEIRLSCVLMNVYPRELVELAKTSTPIVLYLFIELRDVDRKKPLRKVTVHSTLTYNVLTKTYSVVRGFRNDTANFSQFDSAAHYSSRFLDIVVAPRAIVNKEIRYVLAAYAILGKTKVEALRNKEIDLMYYWDYKRPAFRTESFTGEELLGRK